MKILIGTPHATTNSAKSRFVDCLIDLITYTRQQGHTVDRSTTYRDNITFARNKIASKAIDGDYDYLFFLDDDMVFEKDLLINLLKKEKLVVAGLAFLRREPHDPSMFRLADDNETYYPIMTWATGHLVEVDAVGMACTLISRKALIKVAVISQVHKNIVGLFDNINFTGEDLRFCFKAKQEEVQIFCDTSQLVGHIVEKEISFGDFASMVDDSMKTTQGKVLNHGYKKELEK